MIAGRTILLTLNATIAAVRAGEAERGFAIVATEVDDLPSQTARAADKIGGQIARIQGSTGQAVLAIDSISGRVDTRPKRRHEREQPYRGRTAGITDKLQGIDLPSLRHNDGVINT